MVKDIIRVIRPHQWVKNFFIFVPMFFGGSLTDSADILNASITFLAFSMVASAIYCINDIIDVEADRRHPVKCNRPIASGKVSKKQAYAMVALCAVASGALLLPLGELTQRVGITILTYFLMNICYCLWLKSYAIVDVCIIATGFVLRLLAGGFATEVPLSNWIVLMTFLLTLFLSLAKRRDDVLKMNKTGQPPRKNTADYNLEFINQAITITATVTIVCYVMYTISPEVEQRFNTHYLYLTTVFVLLGILRYMQLTLVYNKSGDPTKALLHDHTLQATLAMWLASFLVIIYIL